MTMQSGGPTLHTDAPHHAHALPLLLVLLGIICSLAFSFLLLPHVAGPLGVNPDPDRLGELGRNLAGGLGFSYGTGSSVVTAFDRGPVYPLLVMLLTWFAGGYPLALNIVLQLPLLVLAAAGLRSMMRKGSPGWIVVASIASFWITHALIVGWLRYSVPALPMTILLASAGEERIRTRMSGFRQQRRPS